MKKFLSVLLALAVAFTFTFGSTMSAFAATKTYDTTAKYLEEVATLETEALDYEAAQYAVAVAQAKTAKTVEVVYDGDKKVEVDTAYYLVQLEKVYSAVKNDIAKQTKEFKAATGTEAGEKINFEEPEYVKYDAKKMLDAALLDDASEIIPGTAELKAATNLIAAQLDANKAAYVKNINSVDTSIYSTTVYTDADSSVIGSWKIDTTQYYAAKDYADALKASYVAAVNEVAYKATGTGADTLDTLGKKVVDLKAAVEGYVEDTDNDGIYTLKTSILTKATEDAENAKTEASKASMKSILASDIATYKSKDEYLKATEKTTPTKEQVTAFIAAYEEAVTAYIDNGNTYTSKTVAYDVDVVTNAETLATIKADAAAYLAEKNEDGSVKYDAKKVNENLATVTAALYAKSVDSDAYTYTKTDLVKDATIGYVTAYEKEQYKAAADTDYEALKNTYYALEYAQVKDAYDAYKAAVDAATIKSAITTDAAKALADTVNKIYKKSDIDALYAGTTTALLTKNDGTVKAAYDAADATAQAYAATLNAGKDDDDKIVYANTGTFLKENGARTAAEIAALYDALKADVAGTETTNQAKAAAKAVTDMITALPPALTLTIADKDAVIAARDAYAKLSAVAQRYVSLTDVSVLEKDVTAIAKLEAAAIGEAIKAVSGAKTVDAADGTKAKIEDKAAVKAIQESIEAYYKTYEDELAVNVRAVSGATVDALTTEAAYAKSALQTIRGLELTAVVNAVKVLPTEITKEDKAAVEAARKAYDAFVAEYTTYDTNNVFGEAYDAADKLKKAGINLEKLAAAEATIAELYKYTDTDAKAAMFDMTYKATLWKTARYSRKLTAVASADQLNELKDNGYTVKYRFYKKAPGAKSYKLVKTTTTKYYKYTKLAKGTNYLRVKMTVYKADGTVLGSKTATRKAVVK